jgi:hypothetical protein
MARLPVFSKAKGAPAHGCRSINPAPRKNSVNAFRPVRIEVSGRTPATKEYNVFMFFNPQLFISFELLLQPGPAKWLGVGNSSEGRSASSFYKKLSSFVEPIFTIWRT